MKLIIASFLLSFSTLNLMAQERAIYYSGGDRYSDLFMVTLEGKITRLTEKESRGEYQPQVSPDGKNVVFNTYRYGGWKLAIAELKDGKILSGSIRKLIKNSKGYEYDADWSQDGKSIVFVGFPNGRQGHRQIYISDLSGIKVRKLTNESRNHYSPHFSPDGSTIYYHATVDGIYAIERISINSSTKETIVYSEKAHAIAPSISPDGFKLAYHKIHGDESVSTHVHDLQTHVDEIIYGIDSNEKNYLNRQSESPVFSYSIGWSSNNEQIVFTNHFGNFIFELFVADLKSKKVRQLTKLGETSLQPSWY